MSALRNIGLDVFNFLLASYNNSAERKKQVVGKSFRIATSRCLVHIAPLAVSMLLLWLNIRGLCIGIRLWPSSTDRGDYVALAFIQVAVKVQVREVILTCTGALLTYLIRSLS